MLTFFAILPFKPFSTIKTCWCMCFGNCECIESDFLIWTKSCASLCFEAVSFSRLSRGHCNLCIRLLFHLRRKPRVTKYLKVLRNLQQRRWFAHFRLEWSVPMRSQAWKRVELQRRKSWRFSRLHEYRIVWLLMRERLKNDHLRTGMQSKESLNKPSDCHGRHRLLRS